jgi:hypothetical protein
MKKKNTKTFKTEKTHGPRQGWEEAFERMAKNGDDRLLDGAQLADAERMLKSTVLLRERF